MIYLKILLFKEQSFLIYTKILIFKRDVFLIYARYWYLNKKVLIYQTILLFKKWGFLTYLKTLIFKQESFLVYTKILILRPGPQLRFFGYTVFLLVTWPATISHKAKLFVGNFDLGISLPVLSSRTNLKLHNISVTPKKAKKVITNIDSSKMSSLDWIPVVVIMNCEPELSYILAELFNKCLKES